MQLYIAWTHTHLRVLEQRDSTKSLSPERTEWYLAHLERGSPGSRLLCITNRGRVSVPEEKEAESCRRWVEGSCHWHGQHRRPRGADEMRAEAGPWLPIWGPVPRTSGSGEPGPEWRAESLGRVNKGERGDRDSDHTTLRVRRIKPRFGLQGKEELGELQRRPFGQIQTQPLTRDLETNLLLKGKL